MSQEQLSTLPMPKRVITGHNANGKAIVQEDSSLLWKRMNDDTLALSVVFTTSTFPPSIQDDADLAAHGETLKRGLGLVNPKGTVLYYVEYAPGYSSPMHRTKSLDYGIVLEGEMYMVLDSGDERLMKPGDIAIQRATQHSWTNRSKMWARIVFFLQDCTAPDGVTEDLGEAHGLLPSSGD